LRHLPEREEEARSRRQTSTVSRKVGRRKNPDGSIKYKCVDAQGKPRRNNPSQFLVGDQPVPLWRDRMLWREKLSKMLRD